MNLYFKPIDKNIDTTNKAVNKLLNLPKKH